MSPKGTRPLAKILFELDPEHSDGHGSETLWAEQVGVGRYRLRNTPFYAYGVSAEDVVFAKPGHFEVATEPNRGGSVAVHGSKVPLLYFQGVSIRAGHSTYRILRSRSRADAEFEEAWARLKAQGCTYEEGEGNLLAVDVPPQADIHAVYLVLEDAESRTLWSFEEGHCGHRVDPVDHQT